MRLMLGYTIISFSTMSRLNCVNKRIILLILDGRGTMQTHEKTDMIKQLSNSCLVSKGTRVHHSIFMLVNQAKQFW